MAERIATVTRNTLESQITISVNLDGTGKANLDTPVPFLNHMLDQIARHGLIDLDIQAAGDTHIDDHHTVCLLYTSPSPRDRQKSRMPSSA